MKQGIQNAFKGINEEIAKYGCYFLCLLRMAELDTETDISENDILLIYSICTKLGYMNKDCYINDAAKVYMIAAGRNKYGGVRVEKTKPKAETYIVCNKKTGYTHFTLVYKGEAWDSLDPNRPAAAAYKPDSYRVLI
jgi:hypothetical protein